VLLFWHYFTDRQPVFEKIAQRYYRLTGVQVDFRVYGPAGAYFSKLQAAAQAGTLPDLFCLAADIQQQHHYVEAGHFLRLDPYFDEQWANWFESRTLDPFRFREGNKYGIEPGLYGLPLDVNNVQIFYNKTLFRQAGLDPDHPPKTWKEFLEVGRKLRAAGIHPFFSDFYGNDWHTTAFWTSYALAYLGIEKFRALVAGKIKFTEPAAVKAFQKFEEMRVARMFIPGIVGYNSNRPLFEYNKVAMCFDGSWMIAVWQMNAPQFTDYSIFLPPQPEDAKYKVLIPGGAGAAFAINAKGNYIAEAVKFAKYLTNKESQVLYAKLGLNLPANRTAVLPELIGEKLALFADDQQITYNGLFDNFEPEVGYALNKAIQEVILGDKTPKEAAEEVQHVQEIVLDKALKRHKN